MSFFLLRGVVLIYNIYIQKTKGNKMTQDKRTHNGITFRIESFEIKGKFETKTKHQAFLNDVALSEIEENKAVVIMQAIKTINENEERLKEYQGE